MLRIAHISDLHLFDESKSPRIGDLTAALGEAFLKYFTGIRIEAHAHDEEKKSALVAALHQIRPDVIVVTGDVTNIGDASSFDLSQQYLEQLRSLSTRRTLIVIPGNHDTLVERFNAISGSKSLFDRVSLRISRRVASVVEDAGAYPEQGADLLKNYGKFARNLNLWPIDPAVPVEVECDWGVIRFFLFNSVNDTDDLLMANRGRIGPTQLRSLASGSRRTPAVRIALLHHHPICSPNVRASSAERFYDWMEDGPMFLRRLNEHRFQLVLHGHQHDPFQCQINYNRDAGDGIQILAAGSALSGSDPNAHKSSFNVIELISPFHAKLRIHEYRDGEFVPPGNARKLQLASLDSISPPGLRFAKKEAGFEQELTWKILTGSDIDDVYELDAKHQYDTLRFEVDILEDPDETLRYVGRYTRIGRNVDSGESAGPVYVITGSPGVTYKDLTVKAYDNLTEDKLDPYPIQTRDTQFALQVLLRRPLRPNDAFDVTLEFNWKTVLRRATAFDAISLLGFRRPVGMLDFAVTVPWRPSQPTVREVFRAAPVRVSSEMGPDRIPGQPDRYRYRFEMEKPNRTAYQIYFGQVSDRPRLQ